MIKESIKLESNSIIGGGDPQKHATVYTKQRPLTIGYFADGQWSHLAFKKLIKDDSIKIAFIVPRTDTKDETLRNYAKHYEIDYLTPVKVNSEEFYEQAQKYNCDLFVSMSFNQIFRERITNLPPHGTINCHAGKLPFYRGRNILNWALINDEKEFGITVHYVDQGIDTGDIIEQRCLPIFDSDTYKTLLDKAIIECADILYHSIKQIQNGTSQRIPQSTIDKYGFYCGIRAVGDEIINWNQTSRELFNFIRAICKPGPMAQTTLNEQPFAINTVQYIDNLPAYKGTPGQIVGKDENKLIVKTIDTVIFVTEYYCKSNPKVGDKFK